MNKIKRLIAVDGRIAREGAKYAPEQMIFAPGLQFIIRYNNTNSFVLPHNTQIKVYDLNTLNETKSLITSGATNTNTFQIITPQILQVEHAGIITAIIKDIFGFIQNANLTIEAVPVGLIV